MTNRDEREVLSVEIPATLKEELRTVDGTQWETVTDALAMYLGHDKGSTEAGLKEHINRREDKLDNLLEERDLLEDTILEERNRLESLREKLDAVQERKSSYYELLDGILDEMQMNPDKNILAYTKELREASRKEFGKASEENISRVIGDLRDRRDEKEFAIDDSRFAQLTSSESAETAQPDGGTTSTPLRTLKAARNGHGDDEEDSE